jgi:hypothetical protein
LSSTLGIYGNAVAIDPKGSGDIYITGGFEGTVDFDPGPETFNLTSGTGDVGIFVLKLEGSGNFLWAKAMSGKDGSAFAKSIAIDPVDGDIYTTGMFHGTIDFDPHPEGIHNLTSEPDICPWWVPFCGDIFISKLDSLGNFEWTKVIGASETDFGNSIVIDPEERDVYITGQFRKTVDFNQDGDAFILTSAGFEDIFILKLNKEGNFIWAKAIGGAGSDIGESIAFDPSGGGKVYTTGYFVGTVDFNPGPETFNLITTGQYHFISNIDRSGKFIWAKKMGKVGLISFDKACSIALDNAGNGDIYTTGSFQDTTDFNPGDETFNLNSAGSSDIFISKISDSGNYRWGKGMGGANQDFGTSIALDPSGSGDVYTIGTFKGKADFDPGPDSFNLISSGGREIFISKLDHSGKFQWVKEIKGINDDNSFSISLDANFLYLTGFYFSPSLSFDSGIITNVNPSGADLFISKLDLLTISVTDVDTKTQKINLYPNPATNELTIEVEGNEYYKGDVTLFNILGEVVHFSPGENFGQKKTIDISALSTGIYFVELNIDGTRVIEKLVKE